MENFKNVDFYKSILPVLSEHSLKQKKGNDFIEHNGEIVIKWQFIDGICQYYLHKDYIKS